MIVGSRCPPLDALQKLALGQLPPADADFLQQHLDGCPDCTQTVESLRPAPAEAAPAPGDHTISLLSGSEPAAPKFDFLAPAEGPGELGRLGPYRVLRVLGEGGMGVVFQAEDPALERMVALKVMKPSGLLDPEAPRRFLLEARAAAKLQHDHIVTIYQVGEDRGVPYMAMQFLAGESLDARLRREGRLRVSEVIRIGREAAAGLLLAHERGMIHRDIKPGNIWLEDLGDERPPRVKILDFGLVRLTRGDSQQPMTQTGAILGTPDYMSPEQARSQPLDHRCDLFSLGVVLYQMCTGVRPFRGEDAMATLIALTLDRQRPAADVNPDVPQELSDLIDALLSKAPEQRPSTARVVIDVLSRIERHSTQHDLPPLTPLPASRGAKTQAPIRWEQPTNPGVPRGRSPKPPTGTYPRPADTRAPGGRVPTAAELATSGLTPCDEEGRSLVAPAPAPVPPRAAPADDDLPPLPSLPSLNKSSDAPADGACPRCGSNRFGSAGMGWCLACGYTPGMADVPAPRRKYGDDEEDNSAGWLGMLVVGAVIVAASTTAGYVFLERDTEAWKMWVYVQFGAGLGALLLGMVWAYRTVRIYDDDSRVVSPLWSSPLRFATLVVRHLRLTRKPVCLGLLGLAAVAGVGYAMDLRQFLPGQRQNQMALKRSRSSHPSAFNTQMTAPPKKKDVEDKDPRKTYARDCVVLGILTDEASITGVILGDKKDGKYVYVGVSKRTEADNTGVGARLSKATVAVPAVAGLESKFPHSATWTVPRVSCRVEYAEVDAKGILVDPVVKRWLD